MPRGRCARCPRTARPCWSRRARPTAAALAAQIDAIEAALAGFALVRAAALRHRPGGVRAVSGTCARACSRRSARCAQVGTTVIIEDVAFPIERLAEATLDLQRLLARARLPRRDHLRPRARRQPPLRLHAGLRHRRPRSSAIAASWTRCARWSSRNTTARSRPSTAPAATSRRSSSSNGAREAYALMRRHQAPVRSARPAQSRRDPQRRPRRAPQEPEAAAACDPIVDKCIECGFCEPKCPSRGHDAVAAPAHRRLARDRAARARGRDTTPRSPRCASSTTTTASTPAPPADSARRRARSASRRAC